MITQGGQKPVRKRQLSTVLTLIGVVLFAGCGSKAESASTFKASAVMDLPITALVHDSASDRDAITKATDLEVKDCMAKLGFTFYPDLAPGPSSGYDDGTRPYGPVDLERVKQVGYHLTTDEARLMENSQKTLRLNNDYRNGLSTEKQQEYELAFFGPDSNRGNFTINGVVENTYPNEGCQAQAEAELFGDRSAYIAAQTQIQKLSMDAKSLTNADSGVKRKLDEWASCMSSKGYSYKTPEEAMSDVMGEDAKASTQEIRVATSDVECKEKVNLMITWRQVQHNSEQTLADKSQSLVQQWSELHQAHLERVRQTS